MTLSIAAPCVLALSLLFSGTAGDELTVEQLEELRDEVIPDVEKLRGGTFDHPVAVEVTTKEEFIEYAKARTESMQSPEDQDAEEAVAKLLGLLPADMDLQKTMFDFLESQIGGYYEPSEKTFYVVSTFSDPGVLRVILVHELTHALDDQLFGIDDKLAPLLKTNTDAGIAFHAVVEGSGTAVMNQWMLPKVMSGKLSLAELTKIASAQDLSGLPEYIWLPLMHSYLQGAAFLARTDSVMGGQMAKPKPADIDQAFEHPPRSTEQVLHPEKYWEEEALDEPHQIELDSTNLLEGWSVLKNDTLGEVGMSLFCRPLDERQEFSALPKFTNEAAMGWGGDRYVLLTQDDACVLYLVTSWDSEVDADEFVAALEQVAENVQAGAAKLGDGEGAIDWTRSEEADEVRITIRSGVDAETAAKVVASIGAQVVRE